MTKARGKGGNGQGWQRCEAQMGWRGQWRCAPPVGSAGERPTTTSPTANCGPHPPCSSTAFGAALLCGAVSTGSVHNAVSTAGEASGACGGRGVRTHTAEGFREMLDQHDVPGWVEGWEHRRALSVNTAVAGDGVSGGPGPRCMWAGGEEERKEDEGEGEDNGDWRRYKRGEGNGGGAGGEQEEQEEEEQEQQEERQQRQPER